ncbi:MAG: hypothetical protein HKN87_14175 [Saprospiraceae bacterium]|nr:hypothetical protein [Saprospiraceae bacterium]
MKFLFVLILLFIFTSPPVIAQSAMQPLSEIPYHWLDRMDIKYDADFHLHSAVKGIWRKDLVELVYAVDSTYPEQSQEDHQDMQWLLNENNEWQQKPHTEISDRKYIDSTRTFYTIEESESTRLKYVQSKKPVLKRFYQTPAHLFEVNSRDFHLRVNPLLNFRLGSITDEGEAIFENQRGISIRGGIDQKLYFHSEILESQARYPNYIREFQGRFDAVPGAGFVKTYESTWFDFDSGVDFLLANAYIGAQVSKHVNIELGHGRHFLGNGIRSLFLSDFSTDHFYLKLNTRIWKFQYQSIFGELLRPKRDVGDQLLPKKYFAAHYLNLQVTKNLDIGLFETVVFARENQFELQYFNPLILYRTVEGSIGSPDNVLLGLDVKWNLWRKISLYSQFILDEFKVSELFSGNGWWANKYGLQLGMKYIDLFEISHLDAQAEYNVARPYTYSHNNGIAHYSHYHQALAHPLGANFREMLFRLRYQPTGRWFITARAVFMSTGEDRDTLNWGSNILVPNESHVNDFGNEVAQGVNTQITILGIDVSYQVRHGLFFDVFVQSRQKDSMLESRDFSDTYLGAGIRWNLSRRWLEM